jgi:surface antigen
MNKAKFISLLISLAIASTVLYKFVVQPNPEIFSFDIEWPSFDYSKKEKSDTKNSSSKTKVKSNVKTNSKVGKVIDNFNGVNIYYNGRVKNVLGRNVTSDGYNLGLKYQCVEFVKRYYYEYYNHKMPDSYGHAKDFFEYGLADGGYSKKRDLFQYRNGSEIKPRVGDILIFGAASFNPYGHVAIISKVTSNSVTIAQQNPGIGNKSRQIFSLAENNGGWWIRHDHIKGWLHK